MNRFLCMVAGLSSAVLLLTGCSGSKINSNLAHIRSYNGVTATTSQATIYINNGSTYANQNYQQISNYLYVGAGTSNFAWSVGSLSGGTVTNFPVTIDSGQVYSAFLLGRGDEQFGTSSPILDITVDDQTAPPSGDARYRVVHDAPDAGSVDVYVNGSLAQSAYAYPGTTVVGITPAQLAAGTPFSLQQFAYSNVSSGSVTIQIKEAGTNTTIAGPSSFNVSSGSKYTFILLEPTVTPTPTYSIQQISDSV